MLLIPKAPILDLIGRRPDLALRMLGSMSAHLRVLVGMLDDLTLKDVETRMLNWLVKHAREARHGIIKLPGTKRVLAAELGTSSETLSRTLARLRDQKLISVSGKSITVHDAAKLATMLRHSLGEEWVPVAHARMARETPQGCTSGRGSGMKPSRFGIFTKGSVTGFISSSAPTMSFRWRM